MGSFACSPAIMCGYHSNELKILTLSGSSSHCCLMIHTKSHAIYMHSQVHDRFRSIGSQTIAALMEQILKPTDRLPCLSRFPFIQPQPIKPITCICCQHWKYFQSSLTGTCHQSATVLCHLFITTSVGARLSSVTLRGPLGHWNFYFPSPLA